LRIVVRCEAHQPYDYFVGLVLCSLMDYADVRLCGVHRHPADLVLHQAKTPNQLTPRPMPWIRPQDQMPKDGEPVLITDIEGMQVVAWYEFETNKWYCEEHSWFTSEVLYWMPIPEIV
jgi:hypothetical protein